MDKDSRIKELSLLRDAITLELCELREKDGYFQRARNMCKGAIEAGGWSVVDVEEDECVGIRVPIYSGLLDWYLHKDLGNFEIRAVHFGVLDTTLSIHFND